MQLLRVADPRFSLVTVTSVVLSTDMRSAKVYWSVTGEKERRAEVEAAFAGAGAMFKRMLAESLTIRFVPSLKFFYDDTSDTTQQVEELLQRIRSE